MGREHIVSVKVQREYHDALFVAFQAWTLAHAKIVDLTGDTTLDGLLGLDQLGHFGAHGADLVVDAVGEHRPDGGLRILELGSGYGGVLRYMVQVLEGNGRVLDVAVGIELLASHAAASADIARSVGAIGPTTTVGDAHLLPYADRSFDVVYVCGSAAHFDRFGLCLAEIHRVLGDKGLFVMTEEVSLLGLDVLPGPEFFSLHPPNVFTFVSTPERFRQLDAAGFELLEYRNLKSFAIELLDARVRALRLFWGTCENIFGPDEARRLCATLETTRAEVQRGAVRPGLFIATASGNPPEPAMSDAEIFRFARRHLPPGFALAQKLAGCGAVESEARGSTVTRSDGVRALDFSSYAVPLFGHRPPRIVEAVHRALDTMPTSTRALCNPVTVAAARALVEQFDDSRLERVWFGLNGSDVVDAALKLARLTSGRSTIAAVEGGFHGKSLGALAATWSPRYRTGLEDVLPPVVHLPHEVGALARAARRHDIAAFIVEPIQGEAGVVPLPLALLQAWRREARDAGVLFISDEIQVGFGRCGEDSLAVRQGLDPDGLLLGKPIGGGVMPASALLASAELYEPLRRDPFIHTSTFSGHPASCAAVVAAVAELPHAIEAVRELHTQIHPRLTDLVDEHPALLREARGRGALWGVGTTSVAVAGHLLTALHQGGLLVSPCLGDPTVLRLLPPACVTGAELDLAVRRFHAACVTATADLAATGADA